MYFEPYLGYKTQTYDCSALENLFSGKYSPVFFNLFRSERVGKTQYKGVSGISATIRVENTLAENQVIRRDSFSGNMTA